MKNPVLLAKIGAPHGVNGEVRVTSFTQNPLAIADYAKMFSKNGNPFTITHARSQKNILVVRFEEISDRNAAEQIRGLELYIDRSDLPQDIDQDEFYINDLIGLEIIDQQNKTIGRVKEVPNFGAGDLLEIEPVLKSGGFGSNTWFLAFTRENVPDINFAKQQITIVEPTQISERDDD